MVLQDVGGVPAVSMAGGGYGYGDGFGGSGIWAILLLALLGGRGFGHDGHHDGYGYGNPCCPPATCHDVTDAAFHNEMESRFNSLQQNIDHNEDCNFQREIEMQVANGFGGVNLATCKGFGETNANIAETKFALTLENCKTQAQLAQCCCDILRGEDQIRFEAQQNKCEIMKNDDCNTQKILDKMACNEIQELRDKLQNEKFQNSQLMQNTFLVNSLRPYPTPSYPSCNPACAPNPYHYGVPYGGFGGGFRDGFRNDGCGGCCGTI